MDLSKLTISYAVDALRSGEISAQEIKDSCYRQIDRLNPQLHALVTIIRDLSLEESIDPGLPLAGIPVAVKDIIETNGVRTTAGSRFFKDNFPGQDAEVVRRLKAAGALIVGKTNTHEFALGITGINPHYETARNPHDPARIAGGSSSGSAVAVASGMALGALGTDTGGSIRIPASLCGIVGLKPTYGRVSLQGVIPLSWNLDHVGPMTRTVRDTAILLQVLAGYDSRDPVSANFPGENYIAMLDGDIKDMRIGLASGSYFDDADLEVGIAIDEAARVFRELGSAVTPVDLSLLREAAFANTQMVIADAAAFHRERLQTRPGWFGEDVRQRLEKGKALTATEYALARRTQVEMRRYFELFFRDYDVLILPTTATTAAFVEGLDSASYAPRLTRFTAPFNLTGLPAISLPCAYTAQGLPIGLQIVANSWKEGSILKAAHLFERSANLAGRLPVL